MSSFIDALFLSERHCGLEGSIHQHPIIACLLIVLEWATVECFDVWNTFPGGEIVAEEEYRRKERQIGVRDVKDRRRDIGWGAAERLSRGRGDRVCVEEIS